MNNILSLLKERRIWIAIIGLVMGLLTAFGVTVDYDQNVLADLIVRFVGTAGDLVVAGLALHSFFKPKVK